MSLRVARLLALSGVLASTNLQAGTPLFSAFDVGESFESVLATLCKVESIKSFKINYTNASASEVCLLEDKTLGGVEQALSLLRKNEADESDESEKEEGVLSFEWLSSLYHKSKGSSAMTFFQESRLTTKLKDYDVRAREDGMIYAGMWPAKITASPVMVGGKAYSLHFDFGFNKVSSYPLKKVFSHYIQKYPLTPEYQKILDTEEKTMEYMEYLHSASIFPANGVIDLTREDKSAVDTYMRKLLKRRNAAHLGGGVYGLNGAKVVQAQYDMKRLRLDFSVSKAILKKINSIQKSTGS